MELYCKNCKQTLPGEAFTASYREKQTKNGNRCKECVSKYNSLWYEKNHERALAYMQIYRETVKADVFRAYGGYICNCCGETEPMFLAIDHMDNDGTAHRKKHNLVAGSQFYIWLRNNGYPKNFQVLCCNCNRGKFINGGICPHKEKHAKTL